MADPVRALVSRWREDPGGTYRAWFLWEERLKNFRSIRRGLARSTAIRQVADLDVRYLAYGELERHRDAIARFGEGLEAIEAVARSLRRPVA